MISYTLEWMVLVSWIIIIIIGDEQWACLFIMSLICFWLTLASTRQQMSVKLLIMHPVCQGSCCQHNSSFAIHRYIYTIPKTKIRHCWAPSQTALKVKSAILVAIL